MTIITLTPGFWRQRDGGKAEVLAVRGDKAYGVDSDGDPMCWRMHGVVRVGAGGSENDLIAPWVEPLVLDCWQNVYPYTRWDCFPTKESADEVAGADRLSCRHLRYIDGKVIDITEEEV